MTTYTKDRPRTGRKVAKSEGIDFRLLHQAADQLTPELRRTLLAAFETLPEATLHPLIAALEAGLFGELVDEGDHETPLVLTGSDSTFLYQAYLGRIEAAADDTFEVLVDDEAIETGQENTPAGDRVRTWYDGISYARVDR